MYIVLLNQERLLGQQRPTHAFMHLHIMHILIVNQQTF